MTELNAVQKRAVVRADALKSASARIESKVKAKPKSEKMEGWKKRLVEYKLSLACVSLEYETGVPVRVKDEKQQALLKAMLSKDVKIDASNIPAPSPGIVATPGKAEMNPQGKSPGG